MESYVLILMTIFAAAGFMQVADSVRCIHCPAGHSILKCPVVTCQSNELCHAGDVIHLFKPAHVAGCMSESACHYLTSNIMRYIETEQAASSVFGKRALHMCDICCGNDLCNRNSCNHIKHKLYSMYTAGTLNMTTLSLIEPAHNGHV